MSFIICTVALTVAAGAGTYIWYAYYPEKPEEREMLVFMDMSGEDIDIVGEVEGDGGDSGEDYEYPKLQARQNRIY